MASSRNFSLAFGQCTTYASSSVNAYTSISGGGFQAPSPTYDPNGNTLTLPRPNGSSQALTWDAFDRLRSASNTQSQISKVYDPLGRLVWIRSIQSGQTAKDEIWSWTGWTLLTREVRQGSTTLDTFRYIWGPDLSTTLEGAGGVGGLLAIEHAPGNSTTWDIRYVHYDANGNVIALTDSSGSTSARYRYSPFGELIASEDLDNSGWNDRNIHRFSTKPEVTGTGLLYYGYRYYDPQTGRWPSRDPIEEEGGVNMYGFVVNDGVNRWDYLGLKKPCCGDKEYDPKSECCNDGKLISKRSCTTVMYVGHAGSPPKGTPNRGDRGVCVTCMRDTKNNNFNEDTGAGVPDHGGDRNGGYIFPDPNNFKNHPQYNPNRGDTTVRDAFNKELANAEKEAKTQCSSPKDCCSEVKIKVFGLDPAGISWLKNNGYKNGGAVKAIKCK